MDPLQLVKCSSYASVLNEVKTAIIVPHVATCYVEEICGKHKNKNSTLTENLQRSIKSDEFSIADKESSTPNRDIAKTCNMCGGTIECHKHVCTMCLDQRNKTNENSALFQCDICSKVFPTKLFLSKHFKCHPRTDTFNCSICNSQYKSNKALQRHFKLVHKENANLKCAFCKKEKTYKSLSALVNHMNKMHDMGAGFGSGLTPTTDDNYVETKYSPARSKGVRNEEERKARTVVTEPKNTKRNGSRDASLCSYCGKVFATGRLLYQHVTTTHLRVKEHACAQCDKCFSATTALKYHVEAVHDKIKFQCPLCGALLSSSNGLQSHVRMHRNRSKAPAVKCPVCPKLFRHKKNVERHLRSHTGETPYRCSHSPREFTLQWNLIQHERLHTGEKRYKCDRCGKAFTHNVSRKNHMKYHKDDDKSDALELTCNVPADVL